MHVAEMNPSQNSGTPDSNCHTSKSCVQKMHDIARFRTLLADDRALCATIYECLYWVPIYLHVNVEHRDVAKEFRIVLHGMLVVLLDHILSNFLLYSLLSFHIIWVSILQFRKSCLFSPLLRKYLLHSLRNDFLKLLIISRFERLH